MPNKFENPLEGMNKPKGIREKLIQELGLAENASLKEILIAQGKAFSKKVEELGRIQGELTDEIYRTADEENTKEKIELEKEEAQRRGLPEGTTLSDMVWQDEGEFKKNGTKKRYEDVFPFDDAEE